MQIVEFGFELLPELTQLINNHIVSVPPKLTVNEFQVASILGTNFLWTLHYPNDLIHFVTQTTCVLENGHLVAASQWSCPDLSNPELDKSYNNKALLSWIVSVPSCEEGLKVLLSTIAEKSKSLGCCEISLVSRFGFGVGWFGVPIIWTHLIEGLQQEGFEVFEKWVLMTGDIRVSGFPFSPNLEELTLKWHVDEAVLEWNLEVYKDQMMVGECQAWGIPPHLKGCRDFGEWITVEYIGVEKLYRRKNIGRFLMQEQMRFQYLQGIKKIILWTEHDNFAAQQLFESLDLKCDSECWILKKSIL